MAEMSGRSTAEACSAEQGCDTCVRLWEQKPRCAGTALAEPLPVPWPCQNTCNQVVQAAPLRGDATIVTPKVRKAERTSSWGPLAAAGASICSRVAGLSCPHSC